MIKTNLRLAKMDRIRVQYTGLYVQEVDEQMWDEL